MNEELLYDPVSHLWILVMPRRWGWGTIWALGSAAEFLPSPSPSTGDSCLEWLGAGWGITQNTWALAYLGNA